MAKLDKADGFEPSDFVGANPTIPIMPVRRYAVCDHCGESKKEYSQLHDRDAFSFSYESVVDSGETEFDTVAEWTVKAFPDPNDPIVVDFEYYCPECSKLDRVFDSGDTRQDV